MWKNAYRLWYPSLIPAPLLASTLSWVSTTATISPGKPSASAEPTTRSMVNLYWLPLGAGGRCVRLNGGIFEAVSARMQHRVRCDLYHSALEVRLGEATYVIEMAPVWNERAKERGVVAEGSVGIRGAGRLRLFRYEIRCWRDGHIPDVDEAVESPRCVTSDADRAARVLDLVPHVPLAVWGRDDLKTGDMWNSNSLTSWLIASSGLDAERIQLPVGGRAPGWHAGLTVARRVDDASRRPSAESASAVS